MVDEFSYNYGYEMLSSGRDECDSTEQIPLLDDVGGTLVFRIDNLRRLLNPVVLKDKEIAIVSIAGTMRMGKSFLLNLLLKYLTKEGWKNKYWLEHWDSSNDRGLKWRGGSVAHTRGIVAWGKPIFVKGSCGKKIAVILLDTQGNFEHGRRTEESITVFALSTLFSSMQIFNVRSQIGVNDLDYLQCFVEFTKTACKISSDNKSQADVDSGEAETYRPQFQHLSYLVRDWPNPDEYDYGGEGGMKYMETFLSLRNGTEEQHEVQTYLSKTFKPIGCFLMPEPGERVRISGGNRNLTAGDLGRKFTDNLILFADTYLHPNKIITKRILRTSHATAEELLHYMEACANAVIGNKLLQMPNLMKIVAERTNAAAIDRAEKRFIAHMKQGIDGMDEPTWDEFEYVAQREEQKAVEDFRYDTQYGKEEYRDDASQQRLMDQLRLRKSELENRMQSKRAAYIKEVADRWLDESVKKIQTHRGYFYTSSTDYDQIKNDCKAQLLKKDQKDDGSVADLLEDACRLFDAIANEVIRAEGENNSKRFWCAVKAVGVWAVAANSVAGVVFTIGSTVLSPSVAGSGAGIATAGFYLKRRLDEVWKDRQSNKKDL